MENFKKKSTLDKATEKFYCIDDIKDLQKNKLTMSDYNTLGGLIAKLRQPEIMGVWCMTKNVADWFKRNGFTVVEPHGDDPVGCVNYWISV